MSHNRFGKIFSVTTFGESHGPAIGCVIDGVPPGIAIAEDDFARDLERRATGRSRHTSQRHEEDRVEILSGVYQGRTTGTALALLIRNTDARSKDYANITDQFRPVTPTTRTGRNTASATRAAVDAQARAKRRCASPRR
jgi:chorismate synthase